MVRNRPIRTLNRWLETGLLMLLCSVFLLPGGCKEKQKAPPAAAPPEVTVAKVVVKTVPVHINYVATTESVKTVDIRARVEGFLEKRMFVEGNDINKGDIVYVIEKAPYEAELEMSLAQLARDKAVLSFALDQVKRYKPLAEKDFVTQEALEKLRNQSSGSGRRGQGRPGQNQAEPAKSGLLHHVLPVKRSHRTDPGQCG